MINKTYGEFLTESRELKFTISKLTGNSVYLGEIDEMFIEYNNKTQPGRSGIIVDGQEANQGLECNCKCF